MIVELVLMTLPPGIDRAAELEIARKTLDHWSRQPELLRKHFLFGENRSFGAVYLWRTKAAAEAAHSAAWRADVEKKTGAPVSIRYFDNFMTLDNVDGTVVEFPDALVESA